MRHPRRDVLVIGHGIAGAVACWRAVAAGLSVRCLDPDPGTGATHAAAGMLAAVTEADFGESELIRLNTAAASRWPAFAAELERTGIDIGYRRCGVLTVGYEQADHDQLDRLAGLQRSHRMTVEQVSAGQARAREPMLAARGVGGYWVPDDGQVDPRKLQAAITAIGRRAGVDPWRRRVAQLSFAGRQNRVVGVVDTDGDEHPADLVVLAAGHHSGALLPSRWRSMIPTRPVKGQLIRLDGGLPGWPSEPRIVRGFVQQRPIYLVFRGRSGNSEVVIGASSEEGCDDRRITAGAVFALLRDARAIMPGIDEFAVLETTTRARPATPDNLPIFGPTRLAGLVAATGNYRNGILQAAVAADGFDRIFAGEPLEPHWKAADPGRFLSPTAERS